MELNPIYMQRCHFLARKGEGFTKPNPMVGAVIIHNDKIIGEGYHRHFGEAHAEVNAIKSVKNQSLLKDSTLYVSLEPCSHQGKTPPCAELIISKKNTACCNCCQGSKSESSRKRCRVDEEKWHRSFRRFNGRRGSRNKPLFLYKSILLETLCNLKMGSK